jgi:hypothetical protein
MAHSGYSDIDIQSHAWRRPAPKEMHMKKILTALLAAAAVAVSLTASVTDASAGRVNRSGTRLVRIGPAF